MQAHLAFSALLAVLLVALSLVQQIDAAPLVEQDNGLVTLPLDWVQQKKDDIHPLVRLQQHANRASRRLARMTGREEPTHEELWNLVYKRLIALNESNILETRQNGVNRKGTQGVVRPVVNARPLRRPVIGKGATPNGVIANGNPAVVPPGIRLLEPVALDPLNDKLTAAKTPNIANSLGLDIEGHDAAYIANVKIGTPPRNFRLVVDSASADLWVGAEGCRVLSPQGGNCDTSHIFLGARSSSTFRNTRQPFQIRYGSGEVRGVIISDNVDLAGHALPNHKFGVATLESDVFASASALFDGIMGLAISRLLSKQRVPTPIEALSLASRGRFKPITSYKLSRLADQKNDGEITFGGRDPSKFVAGTLVSLPNISRLGFWQALMSAVTVDGRIVLPQRSAVFDTASTIIMAPNADATAVNKALGGRPDGQGGFIIPCSTQASVALTFFGGTTPYTFTIDPRDLVFEPVDPSKDECLSAIYSGNFGGPTTWLVGIPFLKNVYFSTDATGAGTISLAELRV